MHFDGEGNPLDKSYDSMASEEKDPIHYEIDSDNEPPKDEVGDMITVVKKGQVTKTILEVIITIIFVSIDVDIFYVGW
jgi:hypothetical protein